MARFSRLFRFPRRTPAQVAADVEEELAFHLDLAARELIESGWPAESAQAEARRRFGDLEATRRYCRALDERKERTMRWTEALGEAAQDFRYALRRLGQSPSFTLVAVATLALGCGATTAIFSVVHGVLLAPLAFREPERLVRAYPVTEAGQQDAFSALNFLDWKAQSRSIASAAAYHGATLNLTGGGEPERLLAAVSGADLFRVLGVRPLLGRTFAKGEDRPGAPRVAVLSEELWRRRFGADRDIVGRSLSLDGEPTTVIGVIGRREQLPTTVDLWVPLVFSAKELAPAGRNLNYLQAVARLAPGASVEQAKAEAGAIARRLAAAYPAADTGFGLAVVPLAEQMVGEARLPLLVLLGAVGFVLLIACANVANLLLVRAASRGGEIAVRAALGAGRARIVRQLLTESLALALLGGTAGLALAGWLTRLLVRFAPLDLPRLDEVKLDGPVLLFALAVTLATGLLFGLVPALHCTRGGSRGASRETLTGALREGGRGGSSAGERLRAVLAAGEIAVAVVLLAGAGLLLRSFAHLQEIEPGFRPEGVTTLRLSLPDTQYPDDARKRAFAQDLLERIEGLPGVASAGVVTMLPLTGRDLTLSFQVAGHPAPPPGREDTARINGASPGYFATAGIPILRGRAFDERDREGAPGVVIVNQAAVRRFFPGEDPLGKHLSIGWPADGGTRGGEIVGVAADVRQTTLDREAEPELYLPIRQVPFPSLTLLVRSSARPESVAAAVRERLAEIDPDLPIYELRPLADLVSGSVAQSRFQTLLLGAFAGVALLLAALGIYGVISYAVGQRTQEIGIRMALGASPARVLRAVVAQGLGVALSGAAVGLAGALYATRGLGSLLYRVSAGDPATYAAVTALLVAVALLAAYLPARRAARTEPHLAIRGE